MMAAAEGPKLKVKPLALTFTGDTKLATHTSFKLKNKGKKKILVDITTNSPGLHVKNDMGKAKMLIEPGEKVLISCKAIFQDQPIPNVRYAIRYIEAAAGLENKIDDITNAIEAGVNFQVVELPCDFKTLRIIERRCTRFEARFE